MFHNGSIMIETPRLILRKFTLNDVDTSFKNWTSDDKVTEFLRWQTHKDIKVTKSVIKKWIKDYKKPNFYQWAIVLKEINQPIGTISDFGLCEKTNKVHIGYCIGAQWWHQGVMSEALAAVMKFFFEQVKVNRIESMHDPNNPNSGKVMKKCGMLYEGTLRQADYSNKGIVDACVYGLLAQDILKIRQKITQLV